MLAWLLGLAVRHQAARSQTSSYAKPTSDQSLSPQSKAHQRVLLRMHHFIHVFHTEILGQTQVVPMIKTFIEPWWVLWIHQQRQRVQREMCLHSPALTHDSYVAAIQVSSCLKEMLWWQKLSKNHVTRNLFKMTTSNQSLSPQSKAHQLRMHHFIHV